MVSAVPLVTARLMNASYVSQALERLHLARRMALKEYGTPERLQAAAVSALAAVAREWIDPHRSPRQSLEECSEPFTYEETWPSLEALCLSMTEEMLWELIEAEQMRGVLGPAVTGHIIAGNTPLLAFTSAARALLIGSASLLKLPSGGEWPWSEALIHSLQRIDPVLRAMIAPLVWPSANVDCTRALCAGADKIVAYGSDETMRAVRALLPPGRGLLEYGHRISCAIVADGADYAHAARGLAWDVWVYDQGGCLSPQCVFVEGDSQAAARFGTLLASELSQLPKRRRTAAQAAVIGEQRLLARMNDGIMLHEGDDFEWTVCVEARLGFHANDAPMFVYVVPGQFQGMIHVLGSWAGRLQGVCLSTGGAGQRKHWTRHLDSLGLMHIVEPAGMQCPPFQWRENGRDVLRSLLT